MKTWPVPDSYIDTIPKFGEQGCFWEERSEKFNCGIDIFAPEGSEVLSVEDGIVFDKGVFTSPDQHEFMNKTYYVVIKNRTKIMYKYAELSEVEVEIGDKVEAGQLIGKVGIAIDKENEMIYDAPFFIREMVSNDKLSKLHLELYKAPVMEVRPYDFGNFGGEHKPESLIDPSFYLNGIAKGKTSKF